MSALPERAVIQIAGLTATVECYAWEDDPDQQGRKRLWALGLVGTRQVLEAIWANLIQGREAVIAPRLLGGGRFCALAPLGAGMWKSQVAALNEASGAHRILRPVVAHYRDTRPDFVLLPRRDEEARTLHHRFLDRRVALPLAPAWADWLWTRASSAQRTTASRMSRRSNGHCRSPCAPGNCPRPADAHGPVTQPAIVGGTEEHGASALEGHPRLFPDARPRGRGHRAASRGGYDPRPPVDSPAGPVRRRG